MPFPFLPVVLVCTVGVAYHRAAKKNGPGKGELTPERQAIYEQALNSTKEPEKLRALAEQYRNQNLPYHADMLEKRAKLRELPSELKEARRAAFKKAMASTDKNKVLAIANLFEKQGAVGAAFSLRQYAGGLSEVTDNKPVVPLTPEPVNAHGEEEATEEEVSEEETAEEEAPEDKDALEEEPTEEKTVEESSDEKAQEEEAPEENVKTDMTSSDTYLNTTVASK